MPEDHLDNPLLNALHAFLPGSTYNLAPKPSVLRGFHLYNREGVRDLEWNKDRSIVTVAVLDGRSYQVKFSLQGNSLQVACDCRNWSPSRNCEHVICAMMTVKNLLNPAFFKHPSSETRTRQSLKDILLFEGKAFSSRSGHERPQVAYRSPETGYSLVVEKMQGDVRVSVARSGEKVDPTRTMKNVPAELLPFVRPLHPVGSRKKSLSDYLKRYGNIYPIVFKEDGKEIFVRWDDTVKAETRTELNVSNNRIQITKRVFVGGGPKDHVLADDFAFDLAGHSFYVVRDKRGWELWNLIRRICRDERYRIGDVVDSKDRTAFTFALKDFKKIDFWIPPGAKRSFLEMNSLRVEGRDAYAESSSSPGCVLKITKLGGSEAIYLLMPECRMDSFTRSPSTTPFDFSYKLETGKVPAQLGSQKKKEILYRTFFQMLLQDKEEAIEKIVRESITLEAFGQYRSVQEATRILKEHLAQWHGRTLLLHFENDRWTLFPGNGKMEALLYSIPFEIFGPRIFDVRRAPYKMMVDQEEFLKGLPALYAKLKEEGIQLFFDDQPLRIAKWDFELDATRSTIDWFEIRPEIRCDGTMIDEALWKQALHQRGIIERNGILEILDGASLEKLVALYETVKIQKSVKREIVRVPRLHILDWILLRKNGIRVKLAPEDERILGRLSHFEKIEEKSMPEGLKVSLRGYQKEGHAWLSFLYENRFGACLADDMGLGKTLQALSLLAGIKEGGIESSNKFVHTHLVVVPPSLLFNWEREIEKFYPDFKVYPYQGKERTVDFRGFDLVLTTYGLIRRDIDKLKEIYFDVVIFDEAQAIKNIYADTTGAVRQIKASFKLALTGTPVENHIGEYYSIMDLVLPGLLGEYDQFKSQARQETSSFFDIVIARTKPFILRRTKEETLRELPPKIETDFYLDLTEKQKSLYNKTVEAVKSTIDEAYRTKTTSQAKIIALTALLKLRQICLSPQLLMPETEEVSPKIDFLKARLMKLYDEGHHALVFSQFTSFLDIVEKEIQDRGFHLLRLDGSTPVNKRKGLVESFQKSDHPTVFLLSLKAGGQGLNLTKATYVFHLDPWWNPAVESQASDRAHRIGQKNTVIITRILMKHTIEEKMMELKKRKRKLYEAILESPSQGSRLSITKEDFEFLLSGV